jgi:peptidoglycan hydrolase-like protein with peptidoglycan-binding domain
MKQILLATAAVAVLSVPVMAQSPNSDMQGNQMQHGSQPSSNGQNNAQLSPSQLGPDKITQIQQALGDKGFRAGKVDGRWGPETRTALRSFQQKQKLKANGLPDERTLAALGVQSPDQQQGSNPSSSTTGSGQKSNSSDQNGQSGK